jgi:hypothetical protein
VRLRLPAFAGADRSFRLAGNGSRIDRASVKAAASGIFLAASAELPSFVRPDCNAETWHAGATDRSETKHARVIVLRIMTLPDFRLDGETSGKRFKASPHRLPLVSGKAEPEDSEKSVQIKLGATARFSRSG